MKLSDIPMMHRRVPFDDYHAEILTALQKGLITRAESARRRPAYAPSTSTAHAS